MSTTDGSRPAAARHLTFNRRRFPRVALDGHISLQAGREKFSLPLINLSFDGAFVETKKPLPMGSDVIVFWTGAEDTVITQARVVRQSENGFAVTFINITAAFITEICRLIWHRLIDSGQLQNQLSGSEIPAGITLLFNQYYQYQPLFTVSLGRQNAWVISEEIQFSSDEFWITLPEHGLFDGRAEVAYSNSDTLTNLNITQCSNEFQSAYSRIIASYATARKN
jgi:hypothetical protein